METTGLTPICREAPSDDATRQEKAIANAKAIARAATIAQAEANAKKANAKTSNPSAATASPQTVKGSKLSLQQNDAIETIMLALQQKPIVIALSGPAGSGKTTMIQELNRRLEDKAVVTAMTNKAVDVLRQKNLVNTVTAYKACLTPVFAEPGNTLMSYVNMDDPIDPDIEYELCQHFEIAKLEIARTVTQKSGLHAGMRTLGISDFFEKYFLEWGARKESDDVLIIDEASMLGEKLLSTIRKCFSRIILVGDEFQLPPVSDAPVFWNDKIVQTRVRLTEVHRQEEQSQPLILSQQLKAGNEINLKPVHGIDLDLLQSNCPVIVWRNKVRVELTKRIRQKLGHLGSSPQPGEPIVCRENHTIGDIEFVNNSMWTVESTDGGDRCILVSKDGQRTKKPIEITMEEYGTGTGMTCRYGYVLTCHTAQGSEWEQVMIHAADTRLCLQTDKESGLKWLYTAVTRAKQKVIWVSSAINRDFPNVPLKPCQLRSPRKL